MSRCLVALTAGLFVLILVAVLAQFLVRRSHASPQAEPSKIDAIAKAPKEKADAPPEAPKAVVAAPSRGPPAFVPGRIRNSQ